MRAAYPPPMHRRLFAAAVFAAFASPALAAGGPPKGETSGAFVDLASVGMPIVANGRLVNYVFVDVRLVPAPRADVIKLREKEPQYRDALVRLGHRTPFTRADGDYAHVDEARLKAALLREVARIAGPKAFKDALIVRQTPKRRANFDRPL